MNEFLKFSSWLILFSLLLSGVMYFFIPSLPEKFRYDEWWKIMCFFIITTATFHFGLLRSTKKRAASITIYYMASTTLKLLLYAGIILGYALLHKERAAAFIVSFFLMYFLFTVFEVSILYKKFSTPAIKETP